MALCRCNVGLSNTGYLNCDPVSDVAKKLILVQYYKSDGTINEINVGSTTFNAAFFSGKINNTDTYQRWYPLPLMKNVEDVRSESRFQDFTDGSRLKVGDGQRTFTAIIPKRSSTYFGQLSSVACVEIGAYVIDKSGNLIGNGGSNAGYLRPIKIDQNTWDAIYQKATDTSISQIQLNFQWDESESDSNLRMVAASDISTDALTLKGLVDIYGTVVSVSTTVTVIDLYSIFGTMLDIVPIEGLVTADFGASGNTSKIYNETDSAWVTITAAESTTVPGRYTLTYTAQSNADTLMCAVYKTGFDDTEVREVTITIP